MGVYCQTVDGDSLLEVFWAVDGAVKEVVAVVGTGKMPSAFPGKMPPELYRIRHRIFGPSVAKTLKKTECGICTDAFCNGDELSALPCAHFFHKKCLDPWLARANTCPFCRRVVQAPKPAPSPPRTQPSYNSSAASAWTPPADDGANMDALVQEGRNRLNSYLTRSSERNVRRLAGAATGTITRQLGGGTVFLREAPDYGEETPRNDAPAQQTAPIRARARLGTPPVLRGRLGTALPAERLTRGQQGTLTARNRPSTTAVPSRVLDLSQRQSRPGTTPTRTRNTTNTTPNQMRNTTLGRPNTTPNKTRNGAASKVKRTKAKPAKLSKPPSSHTFAHNPLGGALTRRKATKLEALGTPPNRTRAAWERPSKTRNPFKFDDD